jgi:hypothetical protein
MLDHATSQSVTQILVALYGIIATSSKTYFASEQNILNTAARTLDGFPSIGIVPIAVAIHVSCRIIVYTEATASEYTPDLRIHYRNRIRARCIPPVCGFFLFCSVVDASDASLLVVRVRLALNVCLVNGLMAILVRN